MVNGAAWWCWIKRGFMNSGGCGKGCCQRGSMGTRYNGSPYMLEWMGGCESSMERFERLERKLLYSVCLCFTFTSVPSLCLIFSQCTLQDNDSFFSSRSCECMNELRLWPISTRFSWKVYFCFYQKIYIFTMMNPAGL